jgi:D-alanyl-lipoteichoic acid acyltransferase DltB (MBOAT superfamily)
MVFNSNIFLIFLAVVLLVYYRLGHQAQNWFLVTASYVFYGWWDWRFVLLLLFTSYSDYWFGRWIESVSSRRLKKFFVAGSVVLNLFVLCVFKYYDFFVSTAQKCLELLGVRLSIPLLHVVLPVGISFYTFLSMSYTIDVYRRHVKAAHKAVDFLLFVSFFPHLVAGPIVRASYLLPQCQQPRVVTEAQVVNGIWLILLGYFKKVVIGDRLAQVVDWGFSKPLAPFADANAWIIIYAFAFQIYADFSGYSDIARGLAKLMGFELVHNFKAPYLVANPSAFWRNWHISLSQWLRDYLYIPLGGNRNGELRTYLNLTVTMLLGGLWHGAGFAYVVWGLYHGGLLVVQRLLDERKSRAQQEAGNFRPLETVWNIGRFGRIARCVIFFHITCLGWLFFRAGSLPSSFDQVGFVASYLGAMYRIPTAGVNGLAGGVLLLCFAALGLQWKHAAMDQFVTWPVNVQAASVILVLLMILSLGVFEGSQFIYFQF